MRTDKKILNYNQHNVDITNNNENENNSVGKCTKLNSGNSYKNMNNVLIMWLIYNDCYQLSENSMLITSEIIFIGQKIVIKSF